MKPLERYFFGDVDAIRPYLLQRGILLLLAFDSWLDLLPHGGRYGAGGFNVAHFGWLDAIAPTPTPGLYSGLIILVGLLALTQALIRPSKLMLFILCGLFTYGWSMSMLDSYQHHYLLSLVLFCVAFFPRLTSADLWPNPAERSAGGKQSADGEQSVGLRTISAWPYVLLGCTLSIVYLFTAVTKTSPDWREGSPLANLGRTALFQDLQSYFGDLGWSADVFWTRVATSTVLLQLGIFAGYLLASTQDRTERPWLRFLVWPWALLPLSFHAAVEQMDLQIGWFSAYVIVAAAVFFLPARLLRAITFSLTWLPRRSLDALSRWLENDEPESQSVSIGLALAVALVTALIVGATDLPGSVGASLVFAILIAAHGVRLAQRSTERLRAWLVGCALAGGCFWLALSQSEARFDYYRWMAGDLRRRQDYAGALEAYEKANRYAPPGKDRRAKEEEMRRRLEMP